MLKSTIKNKILQYREPPEQNRHISNRRKNTGKFASTGNRKRRNRQKMKNRQPPKIYRQIENRPACVRQKNGTDEYPENNKE